MSVKIWRASQVSELWVWVCKGEMYPQAFNRHHGPEQEGLHRAGLQDWTPEMERN